MGWQFYLNLANIALGGALVGAAFANDSWRSALLGVAVLCWGLARVLGAVT